MSGDREQGDGQGGIAKPSGAPEPDVARESLSASNKPPSGERWTKVLAQTFEGWSPVFEGLVAITAILGFVLLVVQSYYMYGSNSMTRESIDDAAIASREGAETDRRRSRDQRQHDVAVLEAMLETNRLTAEALNRSTKQAAVEQALTRAAIMQDREGYRARVGVAGSGRYDLVPDRPTLASISLENSGPVAASNLSVATGYRVSAMPQVEEGRTRRLTADDEAVVLPGGSGFTNNIDLPAIPAAVVEKISQREHFLFVFGLIRYDDGFGRKRRTSFCLRLNSRGLWDFCDTNNWVD